MYHRSRLYIYYIFLSFLVLLVTLVSLKKKLKNICKLVRNVSIEELYRDATIFDIVVAFPTSHFLFVVFCADSAKHSGTFPRVPRAPRANNYLASGRRRLELSKGYTIKHPNTFSSFKQGQTSTYQNQILDQANHTL